MAINPKEPNRVVRTAVLGVGRLLRAMQWRRYWLGDVAGNIAYLFTPKAKRQLCAAQHRRAAGGKLGRLKAARRARASYREYARMIVDMLWLTGASQDLIRRQTKFINVEEAIAARDRGEGGLLCLCHFGSWDIAAAIAQSAGVSLATVMADVGPQAVTDLLVWMRASKELELYSPGNAAKGLIRALRRGRFVAVLVDIPHAGQTTTVQFCGGPVAFSSAPAWLGKITNSRLFPVSCWRDGKGGYAIRVHSPVTVDDASDEQQVMQSVADALQIDIQAHPEQWYPFNPFYADSSAS